jgi:50S ribosomal subunit-associated GTPase HflX
MEAVEGVIKELDAFGKQTLIVFNKIDRLQNRELAETYTKRFPGSVAISARTGEGVNQLVQALQDTLSAWRLRSRFRIPASESALIAEIHRVGAETRALRRARLVVDRARSVQDLTRDNSRARGAVTKSMAEDLSKRAHRARLQESARAFNCHDSVGAMHR